MVRLFVYLENLKYRAADRRGVTAIEYALIAALIAVVIIAAVSGLGKGVSNTFSKVGAQL